MKQTCCVALPPSRACLSVCNTLSGFESPVIKFIQCYKKKNVSVVAASFTMVWHGRMEKVIVYTPICLYYGLSREVESF